MELLSIIGERIRAKRQEMGMSQEFFANLAEIDRTYMTGVENGKRNISILMLLKIATALNVKMEDLLKGL
jgi:transcriptional regulator with XRE-family HTH domain